MSAEPEINLNFRAFGEGSPVVIAHGLLGSSRNWQSIAKALAREHRVYTVDLRNHGDSPWSDEINYFAMAGDILRLLDQQEIETVRLVGHSMGGKVAMAVALQAGHRVASLSVLDIAPVSYPHEFDTIINAMQGIPLQDYQKRQDVVEVLAKALADKNMGAFLAQNLGERAGSLYWRSNLLSLAKNMPRITGWPVEFDSLTFKGRTLFLRGSRSDYVTAKHEGKIAALFPGASIESIPDAGHWIHADAPTQTLSSLRSSF